MKPRDFGKFKYDILGWIENNYYQLQKHRKVETYEFYFTNEQSEAIKVKLNQNKSKNINSKLRDMTVYTSTNQFFYQAKVLDKENQLKI